jgi:ABC-type Zn uptake system ZnuABC Zn-binding protein ZnuA
MRLRRLGVLAAASLISVGAAGCGAGGGGSESGDGEVEVRVAASMSVLQDMTEEVGGERAEVSTIVPVGASVETFQPSPSDAQRISEADLVVQNGTGLETWMEDLIQSAGGEDMPVIELSEGLEPIEGGEDHAGEEHAEEEHVEGEHADEAHSDGERAGETHAEEGDSDEAHPEEEDAHGHAHAEGNPHFWLDVEHAQHYAEGIRDGLIEVDLEGEEEYRRNTEEYLAELDDLDGYIEERAQEIPAENRKLVTSHDAFPYFAEAYGFELAGVVIQNPDAEPGSREVAEVVRTVEEENVPAVFTEPQFNSGLAETIAAEAGVEVAELYSDTLVDDESGDSYEAMMRTNIDRIVEALG